MDLSNVISLGTYTCGAACMVGDSVYKCSLLTGHEGQHKSINTGWDKLNGTSNLAIVWDGDANRTCHKCEKVTVEWTKDSGIFWCDKCFFKAYDDFFPNDEGTCPCKNGNIGDGNCNFHEEFEKAYELNNGSLFTRCAHYEK